MFATYKGMSTTSTPAYVFCKIYLYVFIALFIYVVLSVFISLISDTYETLHVSTDGVRWSQIVLWGDPHFGLGNPSFPIKICPHPHALYNLPIGATSVSNMNDLQTWMDVPLHVPCACACSLWNGNET